MKVFVTAAATAVVTLASAGAAQADTLSMWVRTGIGEALIKTVEAYNASHENQVDIDEVTVSELVQKYATAIAAGTAPDAMSLDLIYNPAFAQSEQLEDLTDWARSLPYFDDLAKAHVNLGTYEDRIYGLPLSIETSVFAWNKDLYRQAGLDPDNAPASWAEIATNAEKIGALGDDIYGFYFSGGACGGCNIFTFAPVVWASGGQILSEDGSKATLDTPEMRAAIDAYRGMIEKGLVPESARTDNGADFLSITNGRIGQQSLGAFAIGVLTTQYPDIDFGVTLIPGVEGGASSFVGGDNFVVTKGTENLHVAQEFLEYVYSLEGQQIMAKYGSLPSRADLASQALEGLDPRYAVAVEAIQVGQTPYTTVFNDIINSLNGPWARMINAVMYGDDVDGSITSAEEEMQSIIDFSM